MWLVNKKSGSFHLLGITLDRTMITLISNRTTNKITFNSIIIECWISQNFSRNNHVSNHMWELYFQHLSWNNCRYRRSLNHKPCRPGIRRRYMDDSPSTLWEITSLWVPGGVWSQGWNLKAVLSFITMK